jgi:hypothetical protein
VQVSSGLPLSRGTLRPTDLSRVRLLVDGVEVPAYFEALNGRHYDGSVRSLLVQVTHNLAFQTPLTAQIVFGTNRATAPPVRVTPSGAPAAAVLPTDPTYLVSTGMVGHLRAGLLPVAAGEPFSETDNDFQTFIDNDWIKCGAAFSCGGRIAGYERFFTMYQYWFRTAEQRYWDRANQVAIDYRNRHLMPYDGASVPWWSQPEGLAVHYWLTGDVTSYDMAIKVATSIAEQTRPATFDNPPNWYAMAGTLGDDRMRAKSMMGVIEIYRLGSGVVPTRSWGQWPILQTLEQNLNGVLSTQGSLGQFGGDYYRGGQKNYMVGMLLSALIKHHEEVSADPRIEPAVKRAIDYMWSTQWIAARKGFNYVSVDAGNEGGPSPEPSLNGLILPAFQWYASRSGDPIYRDRAEQILIGLRQNRPSWTNFLMQFDQAYYKFSDAVAWRTPN